MCSSSLRCSIGLFYLALYKVDQQLRQFFGAVPLEKMSPTYMRRALGVRSHGQDIFFDAIGDRVIASKHRKKRLVGGFIEFPCESLCFKRRVRECRYMARHSTRSHHVSRIWERGVICLHQVVTKRRQALKPKSMKKIMPCDHQLRPILHAG